METSRSQVELLHTFVQYLYPNEVGPGVYGNSVFADRLPVSMGTATTVGGGASTHQDL